MFIEVENVHGELVLVNLDLVECIFTNKDGTGTYLEGDANGGRHLISEPIESIISRLIEYNQLIPLKNENNI